MLGSCDTLHTKVSTVARTAGWSAASAAGAILEALTAAGAECESIFLPQMNIERCRQCEDNGWGLCRSDGRCAIDDDFAPLIDKLAAADAVVFANPVYFGDLSESLRALLDRLRRTTRHEASKGKVAEKRAIGVCVAGGGGGGAPECCASIQKVLTTCGFDVLDVIPVRRQNLEAKLPALKQTGRWLVEACGQA